VKIVFKFFRNLLFLIASINATGQVTDSVWLDSIVILGKVKAHDSLLSKMHSEAFDLASSLQSQFPVYIRINNPSGLSTISIRGQAPHQVPVMWQGVNIQNSMNGVCDLALLPIGVYQMSLTDDKGSAGLLPDQYRGLNIATSLKSDSPLAGFMYQGGSFARHQWLLKTQFPLLRGNIRVFWNEHQAKNNFTYRDQLSPGKPRIELINAASSIRHIGADYQKISSRDSLLLNVLYTSADRQIPPTITERHASSSQQDSSFKISTRYSSTIFSGYWSFQSAMILDDNRYETFLHRTLMLQQKGSYYQKFGKSGVRLTYSHILERIRQGSYVTQQNRIIQHVQLSYMRTLWANHHFESSVQASYGDLTGVPLSVNINYEKKDSPIEYFIKIGNAYRQPTLNDLYWPQSGNPDLLPEHSIYILSGISKKIFDKRQVNAKISLEPEYKLIDNYIQWIPAGGILWIPFNVKKVEVFSADLILDGNFVYGVHDFTFQTAFQWVRATNKKIYNEAQSSSLHSQILYTPMFQWKTRINYTFQNKWNVAWNQQWVGRRYTSRDNAQYINAFWLFDLSINRNLKIWEKSTQIGISIENVFNTPYEMILYRPMPGRAYYFRFSFTL
jgi:iron complex outermembrane receptor protein